MIVLIKLTDPITVRKFKLHEPELRFVRGCLCTLNCRSMQVNLTPQSYADISRKEQPIAKHKSEPCFSKLTFWTCLVQYCLRLVSYFYIFHTSYCLLITNTEVASFVWPTPCCCIATFKTFYNSHALTCWAGKNSR